MEAVHPEKAELNPRKLSTLITGGVSMRDGGGGGGGISHETPLTTLSVKGVRVLGTPGA